MWSTVGIIIVEHQRLVQAQILTLFGLLSLTVHQSQNYKEYHTELIKSMFLLYRFLLPCVCLYYFVYGILIVWTDYYLSTNFIFFKKVFLLSTSGLYSDAVHKSYATVLNCR